MGLQQAYGHAGRVFGLAFHPIWGPNILASASDDETVRVWCRARPTDDWEQTSCCPGHKAEVLRVAWSPDGRILASGSADHTVRLWQVGTQGQFSYSGAELAVLKDHPGEIYGLKFLNIPTVITQQLPPQPAPAAGQQQQNGSSQPAAAADQPIQQQQQQQFVQYDTLLTASGESLYLWDLSCGKIIHQSAPLPVMSMLRKLQITSSSAKPQGSASLNPSTGIGFAAGALGPKAQQQQQQQQQQQDPGSDPAAAADQDDPPSYIFGVAAADATNWLAAVCSDGMLRLWDGSKRSLQEIAAVKVHPSDMGSCVSFVPQQPWLILSISKRGAAVIQDIRMMGQPLLQQQLAGPVYDMTWTVTDVLQDQGLEGKSENGSDPAAAAAAGSSVSELMLNVVGCDEHVRRYPFNRAALQAGRLSDPELLSVGNGYTGRLLTLAATADGRTLAAAGETVPIQELKTTQKPKQQQLQQQQVVEQVMHPQQQQQQQQQHGSAADSTAVNGGPNASGQPTAAAATSAAAAKRLRGAAGRRSGSRRAAVDLFNMEDEDGQTPPQQQQQQASTPSSGPTPTPQQDSQLVSAAATPAAAASFNTLDNLNADASDTATATPSDLEDYSDIVEAFAASVGVRVSDMPPEWAQMVAAAAAAGMLGDAATGGGDGGGGCAAASGVLSRAPLFTMQT